MSSRVSNSSIRVLIVVALFTGLVACGNSDNEFSGDEKRDWILFCSAVTEEQNCPRLAQAIENLMSEGNYDKECLKELALIVGSARDLNQKLHETETDLSRCETSDKPTISQVIVPTTKNTAPATTTTPAIVAQTTMTVAQTTTTVAQTTTTVAQTTTTMPQPFLLSFDINCNWENNSVCKAALDAYLDSDRYNCSIDPVCSPSLDPVVWCDVGDIEITSTDEHGNVTDYSELWVLDWDLYAPTRTDPNKWLCYTDPNINGTPPFEVERGSSVYEISIEFGFDCRWSTQFVVSATEWESLPSLRLRDGQLVDQIYWAEIDVGDVSSGELNC